MRHLARPGRDKPVDGGFCTHSTFQGLLFLGSSVCLEFEGQFVQVVVSLPPLKNKKQKNLELLFSFLSMERTEGGCAVEEVCGEEGWEMEPGREYPELEKSEKRGFFLASKQL